MVENIDKTTQNHVSITTLRLLEEDLIRRVENKNKRTKYYELTEKGKEIVSLLLKIKSLV